MKIKLYTPFQHWYRKGTIFILSDLHFQSDNEMETYFNWPAPEERLKLINSCITKQDTFICLGDVGDRLDLVSQIRAGYKILITGNHDAGVSNYQRKGVYLKEYNDTEEADKALHNKEIDYFSTEVTPPYIRGYKDNNLFDEVYNGPLFISDKILLSHERIELPFCINIHGHEHCGARVDIAVYENHVSYAYNVASDVVDFIPVRLDKLVQEHPLKDIPSIHRLTIDRATEFKGEKL